MAEKSINETPEEESGKTRGLVMINTGNGKGKTTAAMGLMLRAWGHDKKVIMLQFVKNEKANFSCHSCGKELECLPGEAPCEVLKGWLTVSYWKGRGVVSHYSFCSFSCLKSWADSQIPKIPKVFLESFEEDKS